MKNKCYYYLILFVIFLSGCNKSHNLFDRSISGDPQNILPIDKYNILLQQYDNIGRFYYGRAVVRKDSDHSRLYGLIDAFGTLQLSCIYSSIEPCDSQYQWFKVALRKDNMLYYGYLDMYTLSDRIPLIYQYIGPFVDGAAEVYNENIKGYIDINGAISFEFSPAHKSATHFREGLAKYKIATPNGERYGYINDRDKEVIPCIYSEASDFRDGIASVCLDGENLHLDKKGEIITPPNGYCLYGFIDTLGNVVYPFIYTSASYIYNSDTNEKYMFCIEQNDNYGFVNNQNKAYPCIYSKIDYMICDGLCRVKIDGAWAGYGYIDSNYKEVIKCRYAEASRFIDGKAHIRSFDPLLALKNIDNFTINTRGQILDTCFRRFDDNGRYDWDAYKCKNNITAQYDRQKELYGYSHPSETYRYIIPAKYREAYGFRSGVALVKEYDKYGFIDTLGNYIIPPIYDNAQPFESDEDVTAVSRDGLWGYISKSNKLLIPFQFEDAMPFSGGRAAIQINGKWGYIDTDGEIIIPCIYENALIFCNGIAAVKR